MSDRESDDEMRPGDLTGSDRESDEEMSTSDSLTGSDAAGSAGPEPDKTEGVDSADEGSADESPTLAEQISERLPARPSESPEQSLLASAAATVRSTVASVVVTVWLTVAQVLPWTTAVSRGLLRAGYKSLYSTSDGDAILHVADGTQIKHVPVVWDDRKQRYERAASDRDTPQYWNAASEGRNEYRTALGNVPAVWAAAECSELGSHVQAQTAQAIDLGADEPLVEAAEVQHITVDPGDGQSADEALADGGGRVAGREVWDVQTDSAPSDVLVPIGNAATGDDAAAGNVVSMQKYYEVYPSVADSEEMAQQEMRGRLAAQTEDHAELAQRFLLIAGAIIVLAIAAVVGLPILLGGGGGGGGGSDFIPLVLGLGVI